MTEVGVTEALGSCSPPASQPLHDVSCEVVLPAT